MYQVSFLIIFSIIDKCLVSITYIQSEDKCVPLGYFATCKNYSPLFFWNVHTDVYLIFPLGIFGVEKKKIVSPFIKTPAVDSWKSSVFIHTYTPHLTILLVVFHIRSSLLKRF